MEMKLTLPESRHMAPAYAEASAGKAGHTASSEALAKEEGSEPWSQNK
jgi:hypothetical protein